MYFLLIYIEILKFVRELNYDKLNKLNSYYLLLNIFYIFEIITIFYALPQ